MRRLRTEKLAARGIRCKPSDLFEVTNQFISNPLDQERMISDLEQAKQQHEFTSKAFGGWDSIPLRSLRGMTGAAGSRASGEHASSNAELFKDTDVMPGYIRFVVHSIAAGILKVRLMRLRAHRTIGEHRDRFTPGPRVARFHIPIITNPDVTFHVNRQPYHMKAGRMYCIDVSQLHSVANKGDADRVHLVFDVVVTPEIEKNLTEATRLASESEA